jgi:hypothetical protein
MMLTERQFWWLVVSTNLNGFLWGIISLFSPFPIIYPMASSVIASIIAVRIVQEIR